MDRRVVRLFGFVCVLFAVLAGFTAWWAVHSRHTAKVRGALLVAPGDVEQADVAAWIPGWAPIARQRLPFPAVLVASHLQPAVLQRCVFAHRSGERGHALMLAHLKAEPLLDLGLRLGEGSGAALAWPLLTSACAILREMASFESAGVSRQDEASTAVQSQA